MNIESGPIPVTDPTADVGGDEASPTTLVLNYLKQRGYQPSSENVRRALEANARDPGVIPGMLNMTAERDTGGGGGARRSSFPQPVNLSMENTLPAPGGKTTSAPPAFSPIKDVVTPDVAPAPQAAGPPVVPEVPRAPIDIALDRATAPQLPAPQPTPALPAPPEVTALPAPANMPQLPGAPARPAIAGPPDVPQIAAPPRQITGPPAPNEAPVAGGEPIAMPDQSPQGNPGAQVRVRPKIAPGPRVQGAPIESTPFTRAIPRVVAGAAAGAARGAPAGPLGATGGAILGGAGAVAPDIIPYIMRNLHLQ
jgi:hypothetical protein